MHTIDFKKEGGFPLEQNTLDFMQEAQHAIMQALVALCGCEASKKYIIYGCHLSNNQVSAGWMIVNNEILYFAGGTGTAIAPTTDITNVVFENGETHGVYEYKKAVINSNGTPITQFIRLTNIKDLLSGVPVATTDQKGISELANTSETISGNRADLVVTPKGLKDAGYPRDPNYKHTDNNFTNGHKNKLDGIGNASDSKAGLAERANTTEADAGTNNICFMTPYLVKRQIDRNKITIPTATIGQKGISELSTLDEARAGTPNKVITADILKAEINRVVAMINQNDRILYGGTFYYGDINTEYPKKITFPNVGTTNYNVAISFRTSWGGNEAHWDNDFSYVINDKTATSFGISLREYAGHTQRLYVDYTIIKRG